MTRGQQSGAAMWALMVSATVSGAVMGGARPLASYRAIELGADALGIGILAMSFSVGTLIFALPIGRAVDRVGAPLVLLVAACLVPLCVIGIAAAPDHGTLWLTSGALGISHLSGLVAMQTLAASGQSGAGMDKSFGLLTAAMSTGMLVGPPFALALPPILASAVPWGTTTIGAALIGVVALVGVPAAIFQRLNTRPAPRSAETATSAAELLRVPGLRTALLASGVVLAGVDLLTAYLPLWAEDRGISPTQVSMLLMSRAIVTIFSRVGISRVVTRFGRRPVLAASMVCGVVGLAALPFMNLTGGFAAMVGLGVGLGVAQPLTLSWIAMRVAVRDRGAALSLRMVSNRLMQTVVPAGVGAMAPLLSAAGIPGSSAGHAFLAAGALMAASTIVVVAARDTDTPPAGDSEPEST